MKAISYIYAVLNDYISCDDFVNWTFEAIEEGQIDAFDSDMIVKIQNCNCENKGDIDNLKKMLAMRFESKLRNATMQFEVDEPAAEVVRDIFDRYNSGWGYKKIANYLTDKHIPTPRMCEKMRREAKGEECKREVKQTWSIITVSEILQNDFYIGTLRQGKYRRKKINGGEVKQDETDHIVFENNHTPIVDYKVFALAQEQLKKRTTSHYRGVKKYDNVYSGYLFCGDCGSPMFAMRSDK